MKSNTSIAEGGFCGQISSRPSHRPSAVEFDDIANLAAACLARYRDRRTPTACHLLRKPAVSALRYLWRIANPSQRAAIACKVKVSMGGSRLSEYIDRIYDRETLREVKNL